MDLSLEYPICKKMDHSLKSSQECDNKTVAAQNTSPVSAEDGYELSKSMDSLIENIQSISLDSLVGFDSPFVFDDGNQNSDDDLESTFDHDQYREALRRKLNIVESVAEAESPRSETQSPRGLDDSGLGKNVPLSLMERLRIRSQKNSDF